MLDRPFLLYRYKEGRDVYIKSYKTQVCAEKEAEKREKEEKCIHFVKKYKPEDYEKKIRSFCRFDENIKKQVIEKYEDIKNIPKLNGKRIDSVIATIIYLVCRQQGIKILQHEVGNHFNVTTTSIRNIRNQILKDDELTDWITVKEEEVMIW